MESDEVKQSPIDAPKSTDKIDDIQDSKELSTKTKKSDARVKKATKEADKTIKESKKSKKSDKDDLSAWDKVKIYTYENSVLLRSILSLFAAKEGSELARVREKAKVDQKRTQKEKAKLSKEGEKKEKSKSNKDKVSYAQKIKDKFNELHPTKASKVGGIAALLMTLAPVILGIFDNIKTAIQEKWEALQNQVTGAWEEVKGRAQDVLNTVVNGAEAAWDGIKAGWEWLDLHVSNLFIDVGNFFRNIWNKLAESGLGEFLGLSTVDLKDHKEKPEPDEEEPEPSSTSGSSTAPSPVTQVDEPEPVEEKPIPQSASVKDRIAAMVEKVKDLAGRKYNKSKRGYEGAKDETKSEGYCARHTVDSINAGLPPDQQLPIGNATTYYDGKALEKAGFQEMPVAVADKNPVPGDVVVEGANKSHPYGHIQLYTGDKTPINGVPRPWSSDFRQKSANVHSVDPGPRRAWRYAGPTRAVDVEEGLGTGAGEGAAGVTVSKGVENNYTNNYNSTNSTIFISGNSGANMQRL